jgi:hypothetical protein
MTVKKRLSVAEVKQEALRFLSERGLDVSSGDYLTLTPELIAQDPQLVGLSEKRCAGLKIIYHDIKGAETDFYRFRMLEAPPDNSWRKKPRYLQASVPPQPYFSPKFNYTRFFQQPARDRMLTITEGEFKTDAAAKHGIACIGLGGTANFQLKNDAGESVLLPKLGLIPWAGMKVCICYDSDAATNVNSLRDKAKLCEWLEERGAVLFERSLPQLKRGEKTGLDDYLKAMGGRAWHSLPLERWYGPGVPRLEARTKDDFLKHHYAEREEILKSPSGVLLRHPSIAEIHAYRGVGKSNVGVYLAGALARKGGDFFRWNSVRAMRVLYVEGEQPGADVQNLVRLQAAKAPSENLHMMTLEDQINFQIPRIVKQEGQAALERYIEEHKIEVLVLDSLSTLANIAMNDEENQLALGAWFIRLRTGLHVTVIYLQHDGKTGQQRGHSKHEDLIDLGIHLTWIGDYQGAEGLRVRFHIDKARRPVPDGQDLRLTFENCVWRFEQLSKDEEKLTDMVEAAHSLLLADAELSDRALIQQLREKAFAGKNKMFRDVCKMARARLTAKQNGATGEKF